MSQEEFESYIRLMGRFLRLNDSQRDAIGNELRDHMEERLEELLDRGHTRDEAIQIALDEFGDAAALAAEFRRIGRKRKWIMRTTAGTLGIAATVLIVSFLLPENRSAIPSPALTHAGQTDAAKPPASEIPVFTPSQDTPKPDILGKIVPEVSFEETPFESVVKLLAQQNEVNVHVNWNALEVAGVDRQVEVSIKLRNVRLEKALKLILEDVGGGNVKLGYMLDEDVLRISTQEDLDTWTVVRVYDCRLLLERPLTEAQQELLQSMVADSIGTRGRVLPPTSQPTVHQSLPSERAFQGLNPEERKAAKVIEAMRKRNAEDLVELIRNTVSVDCWRDNGGSASISEYDGLIVINSTLTVHQQVTDLLAMLQRARESRVATAGRSKIAQ
jgi:hypothetical protein